MKNCKENLKAQIKLGYSHQRWQSGIKSPIIWNTKEVPHILIAGVTGGGKSVCAQIVVNQLLDKAKRISICDFKGQSDWDNIVHNYAEYIECDALLDEYYNSFQSAIHAKEYRENYLIFDEFSSYALSKDSKQFKELMAKISHVAFMGRSFGFHLIFISQQFNAKILDTAIREQFGIKIFLGSTISTETATMLFPNCNIDKSIHLPRFCGYISIPEKELEVIQIPYIKEPYKLKNLLVQKGEKYCQ